MEREKSLLALQLLAGVGHHGRWLGIETLRGGALYLSAEDEADETHIRLGDICAGESLNLAVLEHLQFAFMAGEDAVPEVLRPAESAPPLANVETHVRSITLRFFRR